ncbi:MAG: condensation domain-containing protein, partial [Acidobacteriota bacterium]
MKKNIEDLYKLSPMQQGMLFHSLHEATAGIYFEQLHCAIQGALNVAAFQQAWQQVVERHTALRTSFHWENLDNPLQMVHRKVKLPFEQLDWRELSQSEQQHLAEYLEMDRRRGFELTKAPLMRLTLIRLTEECYRFIWSHHHLLMDGWCLPLIFREVIQYYESISQNKAVQLPPAYPYRNYIKWLQEQNLEEAKIFWQETLKGFSAPTPLVTKDRHNDSGYYECERRLSTELTLALQSLARRNQLTLNTLLQGAWALLLHRYSGEHDIVFGVTVSGRPASLAGAETIIGLFINTLPIRIQIYDRQPLLSWLIELRHKQVEIGQYEFSPLIDVQEWSELPRGCPLFKSILVFENYPMDISLQYRNNQIKIDDVISYERTNYPITFAAFPGERLLLKLGFDRAHFDNDMVERMLGHLETLLTGITADPQQQTVQVPMLMKAEQDQLLFQWNNTDRIFELGFL